MRILNDLVIGTLVLAWGISWAADDTAFTVKRFGEVHVVAPPHVLPQQVVLFAAGAGGWDQTGAERAHTLAELGALTVGFDSRRYLEQLARSGERCAYVAADLEMLSHSIQKKLDLPGSADRPGQSDRTAGQPPFRRRLSKYRQTHFGRSGKIENGRKLN